MSVKFSQTALIDANVLHADVKVFDFVEFLINLRHYDMQRVLLIFRLGIYLFFKLDPKPNQCKGSPLQSSPTVTIFTIIAKPSLTTVCNQSFHHSNTTMDHPNQNIKPQKIHFKTQLPTLATVTPMVTSIHASLNTTCTTRENKQESNTTKPSTENFPKSQTQNQKPKIKPSKRITNSKSLQERERQAPTTTPIEKNQIKITPRKKPQITSLRRK